MANLRLTRLILNDTWPGVPNARIGIPTDGWDNTIDNFSSADETARALNARGKFPPVPLGEKRMAYTDNSNCPGWYTMMYLCLHSFEEGMDISCDFSDGNFFHGPTLTNSDTSTSEWSDTSLGPYFVVSRCTTGSDFTRAGGPIAIFCSTNTSSDGTIVATRGYGDGYGWAWVGGVCPCKDITLFDDSLSLKGVDLTVDSPMHRGPVFLENTSGCALLMSCDNTNIKDADPSEGNNLMIAGARAIGWVCASAA